MQPGFSVVIPAYNASAFIGNAIESALRQTYAPTEVIVVNDGSPDTEQLRQVVSQFPVRYFEQPNAGPSAARNLGIQNANGDFIAFLDADDIWFPHCLESHAKHLDNAALLYADAELSSGGTFMERFPSEAPVNRLALVKRTATIPTSFTVVSRELIRFVGLFRSDLRMAEDFDIWVRCARTSKKISFHRTVVGRRNINPNGLTAAPLNQLRGTLDVYRSIADNDLDREVVCAAKQWVKQYRTWIFKEHVRTFIDAVRH
jgi:glycosyltransferase involved in cell wall biosynthesis